MSRLGPNGPVSKVKSKGKVWGTEGTVNGEARRAEWVDG